MEKNLNFQAPYSTVPLIQLIVKDDPQFLGKTSGFKWWVDGKVYGFWQNDWNFERLAFNLWINLLSQRVPLINFFTKRFRKIDIDEGITPEAI